jgi:hypothetical protein
MSSVAPYHGALEALDEAFGWWEQQIQVLPREVRPDFDLARGLVRELHLGEPRNGLIVLSRCLKLVAELRFSLEPSLRSLSQMGLVPAVRIEVVPELAVIFKSLQTLLCGIGAAEDAVALEELRREDQAILEAGREIRPRAGVEEWLPVGEKGGGDERAIVE